MSPKDKDILRNLAAQVAEIAALPAQEEKRVLWRKLNGLKPERPMVMIDQVCWNEMNADGALTLQCEDSELRGWEQNLRRQLYQWKHFPVDCVIDGFFRVEASVSGTDFGIEIQEHTMSTDNANEVVSHAFVNQFTTLKDIDKVKMPNVIHHEKETNRRTALAQEIFEGLLPVRIEGPSTYVGIWDPIASWMGVEGALFTMIDEPEIIMSLAKKIVAGHMSRLDQLEALNLIEGPQSLIHCTGAWTDQLPSNREAIAEAWKTQHIWMFGLAQMLSTVSQEMFKEYEIDVCMPLFERFGLVYYGCCDPLDRKMAQVRRIPNLRKISMSPWTNKALGASEIGNEYVYSAKPNPAFLAEYDEDVIRKDLQETVRICKEHNCPTELILKDISTVKYKPQRLWRWAQIAMEVAMS